MFLTTPQATARRAVTTFSLIIGLASSLHAQNPATTINVDFAGGRRAIDPRIYGVAYASTANLTDLNIVINRYGGNNATRYNWQLNADNRGNDWYYQSIGDTSALPGERLDSFVTLTRSANIGAEPMLTIPLIGYVANLGPNRSKLASFSIKKYGNQTGSDWQWFADAGNGISAATGQPITNNNPLDANVLTDSTFQKGLVDHLIGKFGLAKSGGVKYYLYDNEHSIWHGTHRDVHPVGATMDEIKNKIIDYGTKIRTSDPNAILVGPEEWGWSGYLYSGYDQQYGSQHGWSSFPDRAQHGNMDYMPWLLNQLYQYNKTSGKRLLDIFSLHYYPQGGEFSNDTSTSMQLRRNRSTRSLWDPNYVDETWIGTQVKLIPRMKSWVSQYYPNTKTAITEYNWGADGHINGATTQADILGIFGREGLDLAARWTCPDATTPTYKAFKMYRNYDGAKSTFGETSITTRVVNPDNLSAFGALRNVDGKVTIMAISKYLTGNTPVTINLAKVAANGNAKVYQLTSSNTIKQLADATVSPTNVISTTLPPQSITLFVVPIKPTYISSVGASPSTLTAGTATRITVNVTDNAAALSNGIIDLEIYDASGKRVNQQYLSGQSIAQYQTRGFTFNWTPTVTGVYTLKVGVFNSTWATMYHWNDTGYKITVK